MARIIDDLEKGGGNKQWCNDAKRRLRDSKPYLKTGYPVHCKLDESSCANHCRKFALSDSCDPDFQVVCTHQHIESCDRCQTLKAALDEVEAEILGSSWNPYNQEHREDLLYDFERAQSDIQQWKAHILRFYFLFFFLNNLITFTIHYIKRYRSLQTAQLLTLLMTQICFNYPQSTYRY